MEHGMKFLLTMPRRVAIDHFAKCLLDNNQQDNSFWQLMNQVHGHNWVTKEGDLFEMIEKAIEQLKGEANG